MSDVRESRIAESRDAAIAQGLKQYRGRPCFRGHSGVRDLQRNCVECQWARTVGRRKTNKPPGAVSPWSKSSYTPDDPSPCDSCPLVTDCAEGAACRDFSSWSIHGKIKKPDSPRRIWRGLYHCMYNHWSRSQKFLYFAGLDHGLNGKMSTRADLHWRLGVIDGWEHIGAPADQIKSYKLTIAGVCQNWDNDAL